jgi:hypothetical protein
MKPVQSLVVALFLSGLLVGCDETQIQDPLAQLYRANQELSRQVEAQSRVIFMMGAAVILLGAGLAVALGVLWKKGGRPSATTTAEPAVD